VLKEMEKHQIEIGIAAALLPVLTPFLPAVAEAWGGIPLGSTSDDLIPLAMMASIGALSEFGDVIKAVPPDVWPAGNNYPKYPNPGEAPWGHKNARGLTPLGRFAVFHMMKKGMMIDVDHMSQRTIDEVFEMAEANPVGYPLNSGHNSFRDQATEHRTENHRTGEQMARIRKLGGLFGVGYENSSQYGVVAQRQYTVSYVENDCGGTAKTVSQTYLQALEHMDAHNVALGTDINGLIADPARASVPIPPSRRRAPGIWRNSSADSATACYTNRCMGGQSSGRPSLAAASIPGRSSGGVATNSPTVVGISITATPTVRTNATSFPPSGSSTTSKSRSAMA
jgi:hypothetical protein